MLNIINTSPTVGVITCDTCGRTVRIGPHYFGEIPCGYTNEGVKKLARGTGLDFLRPRPMSEMRRK